MPESMYDLHVFGLNLSSVCEDEREDLAFSQHDVTRLLADMALCYPDIETVVIRATNHVEAFLAAHVGTEVVRPWVMQLRRFRPDLLEQHRRPLHYHLSGQAAHVHLNRLTAGHYARNAEAIAEGLKASLSLAARCGTLGETLDTLFLHGLSQQNKSTSAETPVPHKDPEPWK